MPATHARVRDASPARPILRYVPTLTPLATRYRPAPSFTELGDGFFDRVEPARFPMHRLRFRNQR